MKILFQGDSVTDAGRDRSNPHDMGDGYPRYAAAMIEDSFPDEEFEFVNLGISGDRTENLVARLESDFIEVQPDIVSVMIGVNDAWHKYLAGIETTDRQFEENYTKVLSAIKEQTNAKILMISPFLLDDCHPEHANVRDELKGKLEIVRELAKKYADAFLDLDTYFGEIDDLELKNGYSHDGVHPSADGACVIGEQYLSAVTRLITELSDSKHN